MNTMSSWDHPGRNTNPTLRFRVTGLSYDGVETPAWILHEMQGRGGIPGPGSRCR